VYTHRSYTVTVVPQETRYPDRVTRMAVRPGACAVEWRGARPVIPMSTSFSLAFMHGNAKIELRRKTGAAPWTNYRAGSGSRESKEIDIEGPSSSELCVLRATLHRTSIKDCYNDRQWTICKITRLAYAQ
jgi:hypothetical protein